MKALPCAAPPAALWVTRYPRGLLPLPPNVKKRQGEISRGRFCRELLLPAHARRRDIASLFRARRALQRLVRVVCVNTKTFDVTGNVGLQQPPPPLLNVAAMEVNETNTPRITTALLASLLCVQPCTRVSLAGLKLHEVRVLSDQEVKS